MSIEQNMAENVSGFGQIKVSVPNFIVYHSCILAWIAVNNNCWTEEIKVQ